jgi:hypothetical protein
MVHEVFDRQQAVDTIRLLVGKELGHTFRPRFHSLDTRGDYLHLGHLSITEEGDDSIDMGMLIVDEWTADGMRKRSASFDLDDLESATTLLDRWHNGPQAP